IRKKKSNIFANFNVALLVLFHIKIYMFVHLYQILGCWCIIFFFFKEIECFFCIHDRSVYLIHFVKKRMSLNVSLMTVNGFLLLPFFFNNLTHTSVRLYIVYIALNFLHFNRI